MDLSTSSDRSAVLATALFCLAVVLFLAAVLGPAAGAFVFLAAVLGPAAGAFVFLAAVLGPAAGAFVFFAVV
jgi:hypothetical protein